VWDGNTSRFLPFQFDHWRDPKLAKWIEGELAGADELFAAYEAGNYPLDSLLEVYDVASGKLLVSRRGLGSMGRVVFRGRTPVVVVERDSYKTFVLELDLATGNVVKETSLGRAAYGGVPVSPEVVYFSPELLPQGNYVDLLDSGRHRILRIAGP